MDDINDNFIEVITAKVLANVTADKQESTSNISNKSSYMDDFNALHTEICSHLESFVNKSVTSATHMKDNFTKDYNFTHICDRVNNTITEMLARNPQLEAALERSGKSPIIAISLLILLLFFSLIFIFVCKSSGNKKVNKNLKIDSTQNKPTFPLEKTAKPVNESISPASSPKSDLQKQSQQQQTSSPSSNSKNGNSTVHNSNNNNNSNNNSTRDSITPTDKSNLLLDIDGFILRLRQTGFKVERIKNGTNKDQVLRLNAKGDVLWSSSFFTKSQNITTLVSAFEADGNNGFILEFRKKVLQFKLKDSELPLYTAASMIKYFNGIVKKQATTPNYVLAICKSQIGHHDNDVNDDAASEVSEATNNNNVVINGGTVSTKPNGFSPYNNRNPRSATSGRASLPMSPALPTVKEEKKY